jgi:ABC-type branched-subunit amino acid transport system ATPase component/ABC-type branched-subunit amino acid transport system permease subunit
VTAFLRFLLIGCGTGGIYAVIALGVVLIYRGSGVINFANGGIAFVGAAAYYETYAHIGKEGGIILGIGAAAIVGVMMQVLIMRPLRKASPLVRVIATLAVMSGIEAWAILKYNTDVSNVPFVPSILPTGALHLTQGIVIGADRLIILAIAVGLTAILTAVYKYTRFGIATTGVAENEMATSTLGWSPELIATTNWAVGGALAGMAGVLLLPIVGLSGGAFTLTIVPVLAAALVGGFASFPLTLVGALIIGILESESTHYISTPGWSTAIPLLAVTGILVFRGRALPLRSHLTDRLPRVGSGRIPWRVVAVIGSLYVVSLWFFTAAWWTAVFTSALAAIVALSVVVITGYGGQISLAQLTLAGVASLIASRLADAAHLSFVPAFVLGVVLIIPVGLVIALPAVRVRGVNLAVITLSLAAAVNAVVFSNPQYTGGLDPGTVVPEPKIFGYSLDSIKHPNRYATFAVILLLICGVAVANLRRGRTGRRLIAVRGNERAAASLGLSVPYSKLYAFAVGAGIAGVAGSLLAFQYHNVSYTGYDPLSSVNSVVQLVIGGLGFIGGAFITGQNAVNGVGQEAANHVISFSGDALLLILSLSVIVVLIFQPDGIVAKMAERKEAKARQGGTRQTEVETPLVAASAGPAWNDVGSSPFGASNGGPLHSEDASGSPDSGDGVMPSSGTAEISVPGQLAGSHHYRTERPQTLELSQVTVRFGGVYALIEVDLTVGPGEVVGLIGPNGAGKTTLIDVATGFVKSRGGRIRLGGESIDGLSVPRRAKAGLNRTFQSLELFEDLTIEDNLRVATEQWNVRAYVSDLVRPSKHPMPEAAVEVIRHFGLGAILSRKPAELSYAMRRMVSLARSVATRPSILCLDEPASGLDSATRRTVVSTVRSLAKDWGIGVLLVEHDMGAVLSVSDRIVALDFGRVIATGPPEEIRRHPVVVAAYLGEDAEDIHV